MNVVLYSIARNGLSEKVTFEHRDEGSIVVSHAYISLVGVSQRERTVSAKALGQNLMKNTEN